MTDRFAMKAYRIVNMGLAPLVYIDAEARPMAWAIHNAILQHQCHGLAVAKHLIEVDDVREDVRTRASTGPYPVRAMWRRGGQAAYDWWIQDGNGIIQHVPAMCAVAILAFRDGKVATVASTKREGRIGLPAGGVEYYECPLRAAQRELEEETGLRVLLCNFTFLGATMLEGRDMVGLFLANEPVGDLRSSDEGEAAWLASEALTGPRSVFGPWNAWALEQARNHGT